MSRLRHNTPSRTLRLQAARHIARMPGYVRSPGADCTGNALGERLGIAAIYAGKGDQDNARTAALLAVAGVTDTLENRAALRASFEQITRLVRVTVTGEPA